MTRATLAAFLAFASTLGAATARAEPAVWRFDFPESASSAYTFGYFGDDEGPFIGRVISTTLVIHYTTQGAQDAAGFYYTFDVPVLDAAESSIRLQGTDLGWSGQGSFDYVIENTDRFNGTIREGRFGTELAGGGAFTDSYIEFTIDAEPRDPIFADGFEAFE
jgi:ABC-type amino acid transport substrate-binding protein